MSNNEKATKIINNHGPSGFVFFMAYIGAAVYFVQQSSGFWGFIWALIKAMAWPGIVLYNVLEAFKV